MDGWVKSSKCAAATCVETKWVTSSFSGGGSCVQTAEGCAETSCVETACAGDEILVRDSKDPDGPTLRFTRAEWTAFLDGVMAGEFRY